MKRVMCDQFQMFKNKYLTDIFKRYKDSYLVLNILETLDCIFAT